MQVDNMVTRMNSMFPMSDSSPLQLHINGQDMKVDINSSIKVPGSPKADLALGQGKKANFWISYKHGDYIDKTGKRNWFINKFVNTSNTHGSGCTLSAAICSYLALGFNLIAFSRKGIPSFGCLLFT